MIDDSTKALVVGGEVKPPKLTRSVDPIFTDEARRKKIQGKCVISLVVDVDGHPQNVKIIKSLADDLPVKKQRYAAGLDQNALSAVQQDQFEPATLKGQPVPVRVNVEVEFRLY